ncbi:MAG: ABC transporter substrate-binding protein [Deinococcales bacterium]
MASTLGVSSLAQPQRVLTLYTSEIQASVQQHIDLFKAQNPGTEVRLFRSGTGEVSAKLEAEFGANNPQADLLWVADQTYFAQLSQKDRLTRIAPTFSGVPATSVYEGGKYYEARLLYNVLGVNTRKISGLPRSYRDLQKPEYKNLLVMPSPLFSGAALSTVGTLVNKFGWQYFEGLKANGMKIEQSNPITINKLINGEYGIAITTDFNLRAEKQKGAPLELVYPSEGAILVPTPIGVLKSSKNQTLAREFLQFLFSPQSQALFVRQNYIPVVRSAARPSGAPAKFNTISSAAAFISANRSELGERFSKLFDLK